MTCLTIWTFKYGITSLKGLEVNSTSWAPPIYPIKLIMAACFLFLLLQGVSNLIKDVKTLSAAR
jgi:TRAP-type mannitol/chloroaromatic compound transport system permease small subunit